MTGIKFENVSTSLYILGKFKINLLKGSISLLLSIADDEEFFTEQHPFTIEGNAIMDKKDAIKFEKTP